MVVVGVQLLHHHHLGLELLHHFYYTIVQSADALCHVGCRSALGGADDAGLADVRAARPALRGRRSR